MRRSKPQEPQGFPGDRRSGFPETHQPESSQELLQQAALITTTQVSQLLKISPAAARNWVRRGRLKVHSRRGRQNLFLRADVEALQRELNRSDSRLLRSRRNKTHMIGTLYYEDYWKRETMNREIIEAMLAEVPQAVDPAEHAQLLLADAAQQLLDARVKDYPDCLRALTMLQLPLLGEVSSFLTGQRIISREKWQQQEEIPAAYRPLEYVPGEDLLGLLYISSGELAQRKAGGVYYTPAVLVEEVIRDMEEELAARGARILDPCCGTGNFLLQLPDCVKPEQIYGCDVDPIAVDIARFNMALKFPETDPALWIEHITCRDYLESGAEMGSFDVVLGNPPWGADPVSPN